MLKSLILGTHRSFFFKSIKLDLRVLEFFHKATQTGILFRFFLIKSNFLPDLRVIIGFEIRHTDIGCTLVYNTGHILANLFFSTSLFGSFIATVSILRLITLNGILLANYNAGVGIHFSFLVSLRWLIG